MVNFLKVTGTVLSAAGILAGLILLRKAAENIDYAIGAVLIVQGIITGVTFFFFANMLIKMEEQNNLLKEIRNLFFKLTEDKESKRTKDKETVLK